MIAADGHERERVEILIPAADAAVERGGHETYVATTSHVSDKLQSNLQEVRARGAEVIAIATMGDPTIAEVADQVIEVPRTHPLLQPMVAVVPLQLLAYHIARARGEDVDQPRNLAKTVTVE